MAFTGSAKFGLWCLVCISMFFIARTYYYGWKLARTSDKGELYDPFDLESKKGAVWGAIVFTTMLIVALMWTQGDLWFITDALHLPRAIPPRGNVSPWILWPHIPIALASGCMFLIIALRQTGLRDRLRHRKLVYKCLGLIMVTSILGSVMLASL